MKRIRVGPRKPIEQVTRCTCASWDPDTCDYCVAYKQLDNELRASVLGWQKVNGQWIMKP